MKNRNGVVIPNKVLVKIIEKFCSSLYAFSLIEVGTKNPMAKFGLEDLFDITIKELRRTFKQMKNGNLQVMTP